MLNKEKYAKEILDIVCSGEGVAIVDRKPRICNKTPCSMCDFHGRCVGKLKEWANSEYIEPQVDWSKVPVDTPILVKEGSFLIWRKRYFAKFENGHVYAWADGRTSWSDGKNMTMWGRAKLAESEDQNVNKQN